MKGLHRVLSGVLSLVAWSLGGALAYGQQGRSLECTGPLRYEGPPVYAGPVPLPPPDLVFGVVFPESTRQRLDDALQEAGRHLHAPALGVALATAEGFWQATRTADTLHALPRFYWASVGKAVTATLILQLADEGRLSLSDPVSRWVPNVRHAAWITIDDLLQHTSGLFSYNEDEAVRQAPRYRPPQEHLRLAERHGPLFCPGQYWRYSNTGYTLLGLVIEQVEQRPYHEVARRRILDRLPPGSLEVLAPETWPPDVAALAPSDGSAPVLEPSGAYAAGAVVGTAEDLLRFWHALLTGQLLNPASTARLFERLYPMSDNGLYYGRGVMLYAFDDPRNAAAGPRIWLGHSGGTPGAKAVVVYAPSEQAFVAVALTGDGSAEATANLLLRQLSAP